MPFDSSSRGAELTILDNLSKVWCWYSFGCWLGHNLSLLTSRIFQVWVAFIDSESSLLPPPSLKSLTGRCLARTCGLLLTNVCLHRAKGALACIQWSDNAVTSTACRCRICIIWLGAAKSAHEVCLHWCGHLLGDSKQWLPASDIQVICQFDIRLRLRWLLVYHRAVQFHQPGENVDEPIPSTFSLRCWHDCGWEVGKWFAPFNQLCVLGGFHWKAWKASHLRCRCHWKAWLDVRPGPDRRLSAGICPFEHCKGHPGLGRAEW